MDKFKRDTGRLPSRIEGLISLLRDPGSAKGWNGPYLHARGKPDTLMLSDWFGHEYKYTLSPSGGEVTSAGVDLVFGTKDDITELVK